MSAGVHADGKRKIIVFGGTGFIGRNFAEYASRVGARVVACGSHSSPDPQSFSVIDVVRLDATDLTSVRDVMRKVTPDAVVFGISRMSPRSDKNIDPEIALTELRSLANVIQCVKESEVCQLVYCSSGGTIYGDGDAPHKETDCCAPKSFYGQLKLQAEKMATVLCGRLGVRAAILRIGNPYGPGQSPFGLHGVISIFIYKMLTAAPIEIFGSLEAAKDYIFIEDVSAAIFASIEHQANGVFNIGSGTATTLRTLVEGISRACAVELNLAYRELAITEVPSFTLDIAKAERNLLWKPIADMDVSIAITKRWIEETYL